MSEEINKEEIERRKQRVLDEYDNVDVVEKTEVVSDDLFPELRKLSRAGYLGSGYVWVVRRRSDAPALSESMDASNEDEHDRVLMILGRGGDRWGLPGGGLEAGEDLEEAAIREVQEETSIKCEVTDCFFLRHMTTVAEGHSERLHVLRAFFDGVFNGGTIAIQEGELNGAAWFAQPPGKMLSENERRAADWF